MHSMQVQVGDGHGALEAFRGFAPHISPGGVQPSLSALDVVASLAVCMGCGPLELSLQPELQHMLSEALDSVPQVKRMPACFPAVHSGNR